MKLLTNIYMFINSLFILFSQSLDRTEQTQAVSIRVLNSMGYCVNDRKLETKL